MKVAVLVGCFLLGCGSVSAIPKDGGTGGGPSGGAGGPPATGAGGEAGAGSTGAGGTEKVDAAGAGGLGGTGAAGAAGGAPASPFGCPADSTLRACFLFDEGTGTSIADGSGNGNTGTSSAGWTTGISGTAAVITSVSQTIVVPPSATLDFGGATTIEAWVNPSATASAATNNATLVTKFDPTSGNGWALTDESGYPNVGSDTGLFSVAAKTALPQGAWTHLAAVADGTDISLFVNGSPVVLYQGGLTGTPWSPRPGTFSSTTYEVEIGNWNPGNASGVFYGAIDVVRIYARAKTAQEICADANRSWSAGTCS